MVDGLLDEKADEPRTWTTMTTSNLKKRMERVGVRSCRRYGGKP
jgi:hypothetical protein